MVFLGHHHRQSPGSTRRGLRPLQPFPESATPSLEDFQKVYLMSGCAGADVALLCLRVPRGRSRSRQAWGSRHSLRKFAAGIREVVSDRRVVVTSSMEGLQNMTMGALEAFLPIYAVKVAGLQRVPGRSSVGGAGAGDHPVQAHHGEKFRRIREKAGHRGGHGVLCGFLCVHSPARGVSPSPDGRGSSAWARPL